MNKRGFTLVELIAIITIIALISLVSFTSLTRMLKNTSEKDLETFELSLKTAAQVYVETNTSEFPQLSTAGTTKVSANSLKQKGYLKPNILNPTKYELDNIYVVITKESDNSLSYTVTYKD